MKTVAIHIGMAKAASTTIQEYLKIKSIEQKFNYLGPNNNFKKIYKQIIDGDNINISLSTNLRTIISHEGLGIIEAANKVKIAEILKNNFGPNAKILIILREQRDWLYSRFGEDQKNEMTHREIKWYNFNEWLEGKMHDELGGSDLLYKPIPRIDYHSIINSYLNRFDRKNICVLLFEDLKKNPNKFWKEVHDFFKISMSNQDLNFLKRSKNPRMSKNSIILYRYLYKILPDYHAKKISLTIGNSLDTILPSILSNKYSVPEIPSWVIANIKESNRKLLRILPEIELENYGYLT